MGRLVRLWKVDETEATVVYLYGPTKGQSGRLSIDKTTGEVSGDAVPGMSTQESSFFFGALAKAKAEQLFRTGEYPEEVSCGA